MAKKIDKKSGINRNKLVKLFDERGHGILNTIIMKHAYRILEKKDEGEVYQCECGELCIGDIEFMEVIREKCNGDIKCKRCGNYEEEMLDFTIIDRIKKIGDILISMDEEYKNRGKISNNKIDNLMSLGSGIISTTGIDEARIGHYNISREISKYVNGPQYLVKYRNIIEDLALKSKNNHKNEYEKIYLNKKIIDDEGHNREHQVQLEFGIGCDLSSNYYINKLLGIDYIPLSTNKEEEIREKELNQEINSYCNAIENSLYLEILMNLVQISEGQCYKKNPFQSRSIAHKMEEFNKYKNGIRIYKILKKLINTHLRNSKFHNDILIDFKSQKIMLKMYNNESIPISSFQTMFINLMELNRTIDDFFICEYIDNMKKKFPYFGIEEIILGYEDPDLIGEKIYPNMLCMAELDVYVYLTFANYNENDQLEIFYPKIKINNEKDEMEIYLEKDRPFRIFKLKDPEVEQWANMILYHLGKLNLSYNIITPILPIYYTIALLRTKLVRKHDVYIIDDKEEVIELEKEELNKLMEYYDL